MTTTVTYKGNTIATVDNNTKTLTTQGKYLEADVVLTDVSGGVNMVSITLTDGMGGIHELYYPSSAIWSGWDYGSGVPTGTLTIPENSLFVIMTMPNTGMTMSGVTSQKLTIAGSSIMNDVYVIYVGTTNGTIITGF